MPRCSYRNYIFNRSKDKGFRCDDTDQCWMTDVRKFVTDDAQEYYCAFHAPTAKTYDNEQPWNLNENLKTLLDEWNDENKKRDGLPLAFLLPGMTISDLNLSDYTFSGGINFTKSRFEGSTIFRSACFDGKVTFDSASFIGMVIFKSSKFNDDADFNHMYIRGRSYFESVIFNGKCNFRSAHTGNAVEFESAIFDADSDFEHIVIGGSANFKLAAFNGECSFKGATFKKRAEFESVKFDKFANFDFLAFCGRANFESTLFNNGFSFSYRTTFYEEATFKSSTFRDYIAFEDCNFKGYTCFDDVTFHGTTLFKNSIFFGVSGFTNAKFESKTDFTSSEFRMVPKFYNAALHQSTDFRGVIFSDKKGRDAPPAYRALKLAMSDVHSRKEEADFYAFEQESIMRQPDTPFSVKILSFLYFLFSDYGRSFSRPLLNLAVLTTSFMFFYSVLVERHTNIEPNPIVIPLTVQQLVRPFHIWTTRGTESIRDIVDNVLLLQFLATFQSLLSIILITLFLLAVRRYFKLN